MSAGSRYRADIDGLRALAVLPVVGFHAGIHALRGGFIGVDIFFVISGYLISSIILSELDSGKFSLVNFYERRVRRIIPPLVAMLVATTVVAYFFLLPVETISYAKSLLAATFSFSNFFFWTEAGYFDAPAVTKPLLHTWSLAVEEQFYMVFPLLLMLAHRFCAPYLRHIVAVAAAFSFGTSVVTAFTAPDSAFYLAHTRAWELLLGTMIALDMFPRVTNGKIRNGLAFLGIAMIVIPILPVITYTSEFSFPGAAVLVLPFPPGPGLAALTPCLGSALILALGRDGESIVSRLLSLRPLVFIGLISYSLYLWHWPIIVFHKMGASPMSGASRETKIALFAVSIACAVISWKFVELPIRAGLRRPGRKTLFTMAAGCGAVLTVIAAVMMGTGGLPQRFPPAAIAMASYLNYDSTDYFRTGQCFIDPTSSYEQFDDAVCLRDDPARKNYLLIGDSHAAHLWYGLSQALAGVNVMQATAVGCKPTVDQPLMANGRCAKLINRIFTEYLPSHKVDKLLIAARWRASDMGRLAATLAWAKQRSIDVVLFGPIVQYDAELPRLLAMSIQQDDAKLPAEHRVDEADLDARMRQLAAGSGARYISLQGTLCPDGGCATTVGPDEPLQYDYGHLTKEGSVFAAERLRATGELP